MLALALAEPSLVAVASTALGMLPHDAAVVALVRCTVAEVPAARSPKAHTSWLPDSVQAPALGVAVQLTPPGVVRVSVTVADRAVPAPVLVTVTVKPMASPAETTGESAVLVTVIGAQSTWMPATADRAPVSWLAAPAPAWFCSRVQLASEVVAATTTVTEVPGPRSPKLQASTPAAIEQALAGAVVTPQVSPAGRVSVRVTPRAVPAPVLATVIE